ncbi:hypothetical protein GCM10007053_10290 [Halioglobus pacificus]|uniref:Uncharacterized protein n=1 Tax=Parahalioglobus pacificus TaxID=930806 RepID=A0A919CJB9_9GAMM|nr:hypothetical protein GCM10007053_10290 [Halioglobus pacificus]
MATTPNPRHYQDEQKREYSAKDELVSRQELIEIHRQTECDDQKAQSGDRMSTGDVVESIDDRA